MGVHPFHLPMGLWNCPGRSKEILKKDTVFFPWPIRLLKHGSKELKFPQEACPTGKEQSKPLDSQRRKMAPGQSLAVLPTCLLNLSSKLEKRKWLAGDARDHSVTIASPHPPSLNPKAVCQVRDHWMLEFVHLPSVMAGKTSFSAFHTHLFFSWCGGRKGGVST